MEDGMLVTEIMTGEKAILLQKQLTKRRKKNKFLADPDCNFHNAILMYSGYSYSWGFYCCRANARKGSNRNWSLYQLQKSNNDGGDSDDCNSINWTTNGRCGVRYNNAVCNGKSDNRGNKWKYCSNR